MNYRMMWKYIRTGAEEPAEQEIPVFVFRLLIAGNLGKFDR